MEESLVDWMLVSLVKALTPYSVWKTPNDSPWETGNQTDSMGQFLHHSWQLFWLGDFSLLELRSLFVALMVNMNSPIVPTLSSTPMALWYRSPLPFISHHAPLTYSISHSTSKNAIWCLAHGHSALLKSSSLYSTTKNSVTWVTTYTAELGIWWNARLSYQLLKNTAK